jgi:hypothetical protein
VNYLDELHDDVELPNQKVYEAAQMVIRDHKNRINKDVSYIAERLGTTYGYLMGSIDPKKTSKPLSIDRAIAISRLTGDHRILDAMAKELDLLVIEPHHAQSSENSVMAVILRTLDIDGIVGDLSRDVRTAAADSVLDSTEKESLETTLAKLEIVCAEIKSILRA